MISRLTVAVALAFVALAGCERQPVEPGNSAATSQPSATPTTVDNPVEAVKVAEYDAQQGFANRDVDRIMRSYAPEARLMQDGNVIEGRDAIRTFVERAVALPKFVNSYKAERVYAVGDLGYARGHFRSVSVMEEGGKEYVNEGDYLTVYRKQSDGQWRIVDDINVVSPPGPRAD